MKTIEGEEAHYYQGVTEFRALCREFGIRRVLNDLHDLDLAFYFELVEIACARKERREIPAILR